MFLTREQAAALFYGFSAQFQSALTAYNPVWQTFGTQVPSNTRTTKHHWVDQLPSLRKWIGTRVKQNASLRDYDLTNDDYEETVAVSKFDIADDIHGAYAPLVQMQGQAAARWRDEMMRDAVVNATTALCYDGQPFFSANHPLNMDNPASGVYSNLLTGSDYDLSTDPLKVWQLASEKMAGYVGAGGAPLGIVADCLMVPPNLRRWAVQAAKAEIVPQTFGASAASTTTIAAAGVSNVYVGDFTVIVNSYLPQTTPFGIVFSSRLGVMPFIWQERQAPIFIPQTDPSLSAPFYEKEFVYGVEARGAAGYSLPFLAIRVAAA